MGVPEIGNPTYTWWYFKQGVSTFAYFGRTHRSEERESPGAYDYFFFKSEKQEDKTKPNETELSTFELTTPEIHVSF